MTSARDPVCGMTVDLETVSHRLEHEGTTYGFCHVGCLEKFRRDPLRYSSPEAAPTQQDAHPSGTLWTCPMDPEVVQDHPGSCPKCGMALEPAVPTLHTGPDPELVSMRRRTLLGALLTAPVVALGMIEHLVPQAFGGSAAPRVAQALFTTPVVLWCGNPLLRRAIDSLRNRSANMFTLISMGVVAAFGYSFVALIAPQSIPSALGRDHGAPTLYFEAAATIVTLALLGQVLELSARARTGDALRSLLSRAPSIARRMGNDLSERDIAIDEVRPGDRLRVRPGEQVPVDGVVMRGNSSIDASLLTGESWPQPVTAGDVVYGGTLNVDGALVVRATGTGHDSLLRRIVTLVAEAQRSRAPVQRVADRVSAWFVPLVIGAAAVAFLIWYSVGPQPRLSHALVAAVSILIVACPCALGLATPMSIAVGAGRGAQAGILVRDAAALEALASADVVFIDKTGTLTRGTPQIVQIVAAAGENESEALSRATGLARNSTHPLSAAIQHAARAAAIMPANIEAVEAVPGRGLQAEHDGATLRLGSRLWLEECGVDLSPLHDAMQRVQQAARSVVLLARDRTVVALFAAEDPLRESSADAVRTLQRDGIHVAMITGDVAEVAVDVAHRVGIQDVTAGARPDQKVAAVERARRQGHTVVMVGDGINDAPALAAAACGIAMSTGSDAAMRSAGITLLHGDLSRLVKARALARGVMRNIRQNLFWAFAYNALGVPLAAGVLYPLWGVGFDPIVAALAMTFSSVTVIGNALRLRRLSL
ncbi:MAG: heavy metal translocating P-type ATPase [Acidobacteriota bacterium]